MPLRSSRAVLSGLGCACLLTSGIAQQAQSPAARAVALILHKNAIDPHTKVPNTTEPLSRGGKWTAEKTPPADCARCVVLHYTTLDDTQCTWTVKRGSGSEPDIIVSENVNAARFWVRKLTRSEMQSIVLTQTDAVYPPNALAAHQSGSVFLQITAGQDGRLLSARVVTGPVMLQGAALLTLKAMVFKPFLVGSTATPWMAAIRVDFKLRNTPNNVSGMPTGRTSITFLDRM